MQLIMGLLYLSVLVTSICSSATACTNNDEQTELTDEKDVDYVQNNDFDIFLTINSSQIGCNNGSQSYFIECFYNSANNLALIMFQNGLVNKNNLESQFKNDGKMRFNCYPIFSTSYELSLVSTSTQFKIESYCKFVNLIEILEVLLITTNVPQYYKYNAERTIFDNEETSITAYSPTNNTKRESCFRIISTIFTDNEASNNASIFIAVHSGEHAILENEFARKTLQYLCATTSISGCGIKQNVEEIDLTFNVTFASTEVIEAIPGQIIELYVVGWDEFLNPLTVNEYDIFASSTAAIIINPVGLPHSNKYVHFVPFVMGLGSIDTKGDVRIIDQKDVVSPLIIPLKMKNCDDGFQQTFFDDTNTIYWCDIGTYTMKTEECIECEDGVTCLGGNDILVNEGWYAKPRTENSSYLTTALCPPGYCCYNHYRCNFTEKNNLCTHNRDPSVAMCGSNKRGFSETVCCNGDSCKQCKECKNQNLWLVIVFAFTFGMGLVYCFYFIGNQTSTFRHPFTIYAGTLLFFYQMLPTFAFRSDLRTIALLTELANFNIENYLCLDISSRDKLWFNLMMPAILTINMILLFLLITIKGNYQKLSGIEIEKNRNSVLYAGWAIFIIIYAPVTRSFIKLSTCYPFGDQWYMWYVGEIQCFDIGHIICIFISFILVICVPYIMYRFMRYYKENNENYDQILLSLTIAYRDKCWYYSTFHLFYCTILIVLPSIPTNELSIRATLITFACGVLLGIHDYLMPFKLMINNHLETFVLLMAFFISTLNISDSPLLWFQPLSEFLALCPLFPGIVLFYQFMKTKADHLVDEIPDLSLDWNINYDTTQDNQSQTVENKYEINNEQQEEKSSQITALHEGWVVLPSNDESLMQFQNTGDPSDGSESSETNLLQDWSYV